MKPESENEQKPDEKPRRFEREQAIMAGYSETVKTYTQLSLGSLVLSVTFFEKVVGQAAPIQVDILPLLAWFCWLLAVLLGSFYQYLAVRYLEDLAERKGLVDRAGHRQYFKTLAQHPWKVYGPFIISFYLGAAFFAMIGASKLAEQ